MRDLKRIPRTWNSPILPAEGALGDAPFAYRGLSFLPSKGLFDNDLNAGFFVAIVKQWMHSAPVTITNRLTFKRFCAFLKSHQVKARQVNTLRG